MITCTKCLHYKAKACYKFSYLSKSHVNGLSFVKGVHSCEDERKRGYVMSLLTGTCGNKGRFFT